MTSENGEPGGTYDLVCRVEHGDLDCILAASERHYLACWTLTVRGKREIVAVEMRPARAKSRVMSDASRLTVEWLMPSTKQIEADLPREVQPIGVADLRGIPLRRVMEWREQALKTQEAAEGYGPITLVSKDHVYDFPQLSDTEREHLIDAVRYVTAVQQGSRSPAKAIADYRHIDHRTAQGRVAKARKLGFLTPVQQGRLGSDLTPKAKRTIEAMERWAEAIQGDGNG
jgi:hypothetical protein